MAYHSALRIICNMRRKLSSSQSSVASKFKESMKRKRISLSFSGPSGEFERKGLRQMRKRIKLDKSFERTPKKKVQSKKHLPLKGPARKKVTSGNRVSIGLRQMRKRVKLEDTDEKSYKRSPKMKVKSMKPSALKGPAPIILRKKFGVRVASVWTSAGYVLVIKETSAVKIIHSSSSRWLEEQ
ncbi:slender lobes-like protein [Drosophila mauritiana]|uniref:Slender lobes-like protein n=1 Tax=Drosophila mauritiana TaxID=7226 RepID=A0A6P8K2Z3_DROMA|nr:slender lobes-like protein [Drosophila mauritiana]